MIPMTEKQKNELRKFKKVAKAVMAQDKRLLKELAKR